MRRRGGSLVAYKIGEQQAPGSNPVFPHHTVLFSEGCKMEKSVNVLKGLSHEIFTGFFGMYGFI